MHESNEFREWKADTGILIKTSALESHEQNGAAERSLGAVLSVRATKMQLEGQLPEELWNEIYPVAGYILTLYSTREILGAIPGAIPRAISAENSKTRSSLHFFELD